MIVIIRSMFTANASHLKICERQASSDEQSLPGNMIPLDGEEIRQVPTPVTV